MEKEILRISNLHKTFPGVHALKGVQLQILSGEVHALVGENGAGKSTFIKCVMGVYQQDAGKGEFYLEGEKINIENPQMALKLGLGAVYQDPMMVPHLTVTENFFLGALLKKNGLVSWKEMHKNAQKILDELNIDVDVKNRLGNLSIAKQEMIAIAKLYSNNCKIAIFDEPTALLANEEVELLFNLIRTLKKKGMGILYVSHRLEEIFTICDRITVFKDGEYIKTVNTKDSNEDSIINLMVGRNIENFYNIKKNKPSNDIILDVKNLSAEESFKNINFSVKKGEIFGLFGLVGAGRTEVMEAIFGARKYVNGEIYFRGKEIYPKNPKKAIKSGIGFLTEDRKKTGLFLNLTCLNNINSLSYKRMSHLGIIRFDDEKKNAQHYQKKFRIKTPSLSQIVKNLSGGNQQKVVLSKWISNDSELLIIDEPTVGVDVGAKVEIYHLLEDLLAMGKSIILISSYLPEVLGLSDRIMVMAEGKQMAIIERKDYKLEEKKHEEKFIKLASGIA